MKVYPARCCTCGQSLQDVHPKPGYITTAKASQKVADAGIGMSQQTISELARVEFLRCYRVGKKGRLYVLESDLDGLIQHRLSEIGLHTDV